MTAMTQPGSRRAEIVALAQQGIAPREIALQLGCQPSTVHHYLWLARREDGFNGRFKTGSPREVGSSSTVIPRRLADVLRPAAAARGLTVNALAQSILARVAEDGLIDAVLDDGAEEAVHG